MPVDLIPQPPFRHSVWEGQVSLLGSGHYGERLGIATSQTPSHAEERKGAGG